MNCFIMNENLYSSLSDFVERKYDSEQTPATPISVKSNICNANFEREEKDSFELGNIFSDGSSSFLSEYKDKFDGFCKPLLTDRKEMFEQLFKNDGYGQEFFMDHQGMTYDGNHVTTLDLTMNHLKKGICGPVPRKFTKGKYIPEAELTFIYPNLTKWGLEEKLRVNQHTNNSTCKALKDVSEYKTKFSC